MSGTFLFVHVNEWAPFRSPDTIPISLGYILAALKQQGHGGEILGDYKDRPLHGSDFKAAFKRLQPTVIGFTAYAENMDRVRFWARFAKHIKRDVITVIGGPQATFMPGKALMEMAEIDILCRGDGELVMTEMARRLAAGQALTTVPGICLLKDNIPLDTGHTSLPANLDTLPSPYLDNTLDISRKERAILFSSRGCTANCSFCYTPGASRRAMQYHSVERVVEEMRYLKTNGCSDFWFADPNFASSRERLEDICRGIISGAPGIGFWCQARYNLLDRALLKLLKEAGAHTIAFGLESSHIETLKKVKKAVNPDDLAETISMAQAEGLNVELFSLFGLPGDSFKSSLATLEYVKDNNIMIEGNAISQQLHLFFGIPISDDPEKHGVYPGSQTRPAYHSIGRDFSTADMSTDDIHTMSLLWRLNRTDFQEHVDQGHDIFTVAGFITRHFDRLGYSPQRDLLLHSIYTRVDEPVEAANALIRLRDNWGSHPACQPLLSEPVTGYRTKRRARATPGAKVIFDCKGVVDGITVPHTEQYYQIGVLGQGSLLESFERGLLGTRAGSAVQFDVYFPKDYGNRELAGRTIPFQVYLHQVLEPVSYAGPEDMGERASRNMYRFDDLYNLKKHTEILYYMALRDSVLHSLNGNLNDMLALFDYRLKLGFIEKAMDLAYDFPDEPTIMGHLGRILQVNDYADESLYFLEKARGTNAEMENQRIRAFMKLGRFDEAESAAANPLLATSLETLNLKVQLAEKGSLPVSTYLKRMDVFLDTHVRVASAPV